MFSYYTTSIYYHYSSIEVVLRQCLATNQMCHWRVEVYSLTCSRWPQWDTLPPHVWVHTPTNTHTHTWLLYVQLTTYIQTFYCDIHKCLPHSCCSAYQPIKVSQSGRMMSIFINQWQPTTVRWVASDGTLILQLYLKSMIRSNIIIC